MSITEFLGEPVVNAVYTKEACEQRRLRIRASFAAYTYEFKAESVMSDAEFDEICKKIDPSITTGNPVMDNFFKTEFNPDTGMWIRDHPQLDRLEAIYFMFKNPNKDYYRNKNIIYKLVKKNSP